MTDEETQERVQALHDTLTALEQAGRREVAAKRKAIRKTKRRPWWHRLTVKTRGIDWPAETMTAYDDTDSPVYEYYGISAYDRRF